MAGSASNWYKVSAGPLKGQTVYIAKSQKTGLTHEQVMGLVNSDYAPYIANKQLPKGMAQKGGALYGKAVAPTAQPKRRVFTSLQEADAFAKDFSQPWAQSIAARHENGLVRYQQGDNYDLNKALRHGMSITPDTLPAVADLRDRIDGAFANAPSIPEPITVHRGMGLSNELARKTAQDWVVGGEYEDPGFMSTSLSQQVAMKDFGSGEAAQIEIRLPAGQKAIYMQSLPNRDQDFDPEHEILLPRNTRYRVVEKTELGRNRYNVVLEVI